MKRNVALFGLVIGLLMPLIGILAMYFIKFSQELTVEQYISNLFSNGKFGSMVISLSALLNIIPFLYYTNRRLDLTARGILVATMLYAVLFILLKFVWS